MANAVYNSFKKEIANGTIDLDTDSIKVMLVISSYAPDIDAHTCKSDVTNEASGTGYTAGGTALANKSVTQNNTTDKGVFDADDVVWAGSSVTARGAVIYKDTGTASTSPLIAYVDFGADKTSLSGNFAITWDATGILTLS